MSIIHLLRRTPVCGFFLAIAFYLMLAGCGSTSSSSGTGAQAQSCNSTSCGTVLVNLMDANYGFDSYSVDAVSLTLTRSDGTSVQVLPVTARADFASLADIKELLVPASVPTGTYTGGTLRLDFSKASIFVNVSGTPTQAVAVDASGKAMSTVDLTIQLDAGNALVVDSTKPALLELDLDLMASNTIQQLPISVQVTVKPSLAAATDLLDGRDLRVRGSLVSVDSPSSSYQINVQPFQLASVTLGQLSIQTNASTLYEINGTAYTGANGLTALAALPAGTLTTATGTISAAQRTITAKQVYAGSSVAGTQFDAISGTVIARTGTQLTVRGATLTTRTGTASFSSADASLTVGTGTMVRQVGLTGFSTFDSSAISVGQRIFAFGQASTDANGVVSLDATNGRVRLLPTSLLGVVTSSTAGTLTLNLQALDGRDPAVFNFAGTGATTAQDADPTNYEVALSNVSAGNFAVGSSAAAVGFVTPFGTAPPDFQSAVTVGFDSTTAVLALKWSGGTSMPFLSANSAGIMIDNTNASIGDPHEIVVGARRLDILTLTTPPSIVPDSTKNGAFVVTDSLRSEVFSDFGAFTARIMDKLAGGGKLVGLTATGAYDMSTSQLTSSRVLAAF